MTGNTSQAQEKLELSITLATSANEQMKELEDKLRKEGSVRESANKAANAVRRAVADLKALQVDQLHTKPLRAVARQLRDVASITSQALLQLEMALIDTDHSTARIPVAAQDLRRAMIGIAGLVAGIKVADEKAGKMSMEGLEVVLDGTLAKAASLLAAEPNPINVRSELGDERDWLTPITPGGLQGLQAAAATAQVKAAREDKENGRTAQPSHHQDEPRHRSDSQDWHSPSSWGNRADQDDTAHYTKRRHT